MIYGVFEKGARAADEGRRDDVHMGMRALSTNRHRQRTHSPTYYITMHTSTFSTVSQNIHVERHNFHMHRHCTNSLSVTKTEIVQKTFCCGTMKVHRKLFARMLLRLILYGTHLTTFLGPTLRWRQNLGPNRRLANKFYP